LNSGADFKSAPASYSLAAQTKVSAAISDLQCDDQQLAPNRNQDGGLSNHSPPSLKSA
jgi:hypothetical protein